MRLFRYLLAIVVIALFSSAPAAAEEVKVNEAGLAIVGKAMYRPYCVSCHGAEGLGDGTFASSMMRKPTNLTLLSAANGGEFPLERVKMVIDGRVQVEGHSTMDMPAWGDVFLAKSSGEEEVQLRIDQLTYFIKSIQVE